MTALIAKIGPQHFSSDVSFRLRSTEDWEGKTLQIPIPKDTRKQPVKETDYSNCKTLFIWTHVDDRKYPDLKGQ